MYIYLIQNTYSKDLLHRTSRLHDDEMSGVQRVLQMMRTFYIQRFIPFYVCMYVYINTAKIYTPVMTTCRST